MIHMIVCYHFQPDISSAECCIVTGFTLYTCLFFFPYNLQNGCADNASTSSQV